MGYFTWIILLFFVCLWTVWLSVCVNKNPKSGLFYLMFLPLYIWPFVAKVSKNLVFDGLLYDVLTVVFYAVCFILLGQAKNFTPLNYCGILLSTVGLWLIKL